MNSYNSINILKNRFQPYICSNYANTWKYLWMYICQRIYYFPIWYWKNLKCFIYTHLFTYLILGHDYPWECKLFQLWLWFKKGRAMPDLWRSRGTRFQVFLKNLMDMRKIKDDPKYPLCALFMTFLPLEAPCLSQGQYLINTKLL